MPTIDELEQKIEHLKQEKRILELEKEIECLKKQIEHMKCNHWEASPCYPWWEYVPTTTCITNGIYKSDTSSNSFQVII